MLMVTKHNLVHPFLKNCRIKKYSLLLMNLNFCNIIWIVLLLHANCQNFELAKVYVSNRRSGRGNDCSSVETACGSLQYGYEKARNQALIYLTSDIFSSEAGHISINRDISIMPSNNNVKSTYTIDSKYIGDLNSGLFSVDGESESRPIVSVERLIFNFSLFKDVPQRILFYTKKGITHLSNCIFQSERSNDFYKINKIEGNAIIVSNDEMHINSCEFQNLFTSEHLIHGYNKLIINDCSFINNTVGCLVLVKDNISDSIIKNCLFDNNNVIDYNTYIYINSSIICNMTIEQCNFKGNNNNNNKENEDMNIGAIVYKGNGSDNENLIIKSSTFKDFITKENVIKILQNDEVPLYKDTVYQHKYEGHSLELVAEAVNYEIYNCSFIDCGDGELVNVKKNEYRNVDYIIPDDYPSVIRAVLVVNSVNISHCSFVNCRYNNMGFVVFISIFQVKVDTGSETRTNLDVNIPNDEPVLQHAKGIVEYSIFKGCTSRSGCSIFFLASEGLNNLDSYVTECLFDGSSNTEGNECPSALLVNNMNKDCIVKITSCTFNNCYSVSLGGASMLSVSDGKVEISNTSFNQCSSELLGGALCVGIISGNLKIFQCSFVKCEVKNGNNGALYTLLAEGGDGCDCYISGCKFDGCSAKNGNGGGLFCYINNDKGKLHIVGDEGMNSFKNCSASRYEFEEDDEGKKKKSCGGGIYLFLSKDISTLILNLLEFGSGRDANTADSGFNLYVNYDYLSGGGDNYKLNSFTFFDFVDKNIDEYIGYPMVVSGEKEEFSLIGYYFKLPIGKSLIYFNKNGSDNNNCSSPKRPCKDITIANDLVRIGIVNVTIVDEYELSTSINTAIDDYHIGWYVTGYNDNVNISIDGGCFTGGSLSVENVDFIIKSTPDDCFIQISEGYLYLKNVKMYPEGETNRMEVGDCFIFCQISVDTIIESCEFKRFLAKSGFIFIEGSDDNGLRERRIWITNTTFDDFQSSYDDDADIRGLCVVVTSNTNLKIGENGMNDTFKNCKAKYGGSIYMDLLSVPKEFKLEYINIIYEPKENDIKDILARDVYIKSEYLDKISTPECLPLVTKLSDDDNSWVGQYNGDTFILSYAVNRKGDCALYISEGGTDEPEIKGEEIINNDCRNNNRACKTFDQAFWMNTYGLKNVTVVGNYTFNETASASYYYYYITSDSNDSYIFPNGGCLTISADTTIENIRFILNKNNTLEQPLTVSKIVEVKKGIFKMNEVSFKPDNDCNISYSYSSLIQLTGGECEITGCNFTNITERKVSEDSNSINGLGIYGSNMDRLLLYNCSFDGCVTEGDGGAIYLDIADEGNVQLGSYDTNTTFYRCSGRDGGAIHIKSNTQDVSLLVQNLTFGNKLKDENFAKRGRNIFVYSTYLYNIINNHNFPMLVGINEDDDGYFGENSVINVTLGKILKGEEKLSAGSKTLYVGDGRESIYSAGFTNIKKDDIKSDLKQALISESTNVLFIIIAGTTYTGITYIQGYGFEINGINSRATIKEKEVSRIIEEDVEKEIRDEEDLVFIIRSNTKFKLLRIELLDRMYRSVIEVQRGLLTLSSISFYSKNYNSTINEGIINIKGGSGDLTVCDFREIILNNGNGGGIIAEIEDKERLKVIGSTFYNVKAINGNGGGIYVNVKDGGSFTVDMGGGKKGSFKRCGAYDANNNNNNNEGEGEEGEGEGGINSRRERRRNQEGEGESQPETEPTEVKKGRGGGVYIKVGKSPYKLYMNNIDFGEGEDINEGEGRNVYIEAVDLKSVVNNNNFPIFEDGNTGDFMGNSEGDTECEDIAKLAKGGSEFKWWIIVVVVVVVVVVVIIIIIIIIIIFKKKNSNKDNNKNVEMKNDENKEDNKEDEQPLKADEEEEEGGSVKNPEGEGNREGEGEGEGEGGDNNNNNNNNNNGESEGEGEGDNNNNNNEKKEGQEEVEQQQDTHTPLQTDEEMEGKEGGGEGGEGGEGGGGEGEGGGGGAGEGASAGGEGGEEGEK